MGKAYGGRQPISGGVVQLWAVGTTTDGAASTALITSLTAETSDGTGVGATPPTATTAFGWIFHHLASLHLPHIVNSCVHHHRRRQSGAVSGHEQRRQRGDGCAGAVRDAEFQHLHHRGRGDDGDSYLSSVNLYEFVLGNWIGFERRSGLVAAFTLANELANTTTGLSPGTNVPNGFTVPTQAINTMAIDLSLHQLRWRCCRGTIRSAAICSARPTWVRHPRMSLPHC